MKYVFSMIIFSFLIGCSATTIEVGEDSLKQSLSSEITYISDDLLILNDDAKEIPMIEFIKNMAQVKEIKEGVFQGVVVDFLEGGVEPTIDFYTWTKTEDLIELIDLIKYNNVNFTYGFEMGKFYLHLWEEHNDFFVSYHDLQLTDEVLLAGKAGNLFPTQASIGTSKNQLIIDSGKPIVSDWYNGGTLYSYNDIIYILDETDHIIAINMPGNRIKTTLQNVSTILGSPTSTQYSELENNISYIYELGDYLLSFEAEREISTILNIWLESK